MDYHKHYAALIERSRGRTLDGYVERHHIVPRCLGGDDEPSNIARLTAEEHYVAHQLLVRLNPGNRSLLFAAWSMTSGPYRSNKRYGWLRRRVAEAQTGTTHSEETRRKLSEAAKGRKLPPERAEALHAARRAAVTTAQTRALLSAALKGRPKTSEHKAAMADARRQINYTPELRAKLAANKGKPLNERQRAALLAATKGKPLSDDHKAKVAAAKRGTKQPAITCPHCQKIGGESLMKRWHFENCRSHP